MIWVNIYYTIGFWIAYNSILFSFKHNVDGFRTEYMKLDEPPKCVALILLIIIISTVWPLSVTRALMN